MGSFLLPAPCLACGRPTDGGHLGLCLPCRSALRVPGPGCSRCARELAAPLPPDFVCSRCRREPPAFVRLVAAWRYQAPLDAVVGAMKYRRLPYLGRHLAVDLLPRLGIAGPFDVVVAVPLHPFRLWSRGFNQAERIAEALAEALELPWVAALVRHRATPTQTRLPRTLRRANVAGAFRPRWRAERRLAGRHVLLVDDVATTGATLDAAATALLAGGAERVTAAVAGLTPDPANRG